MSLITAIKHSTVRHMMYAFVMGVKQANPETTLEKAVDMFYSHFDLTEEDFITKASARTQLSRLAREVYSRKQKTDGRKKQIQH
jgi:hypothetical protein